MKLTETIKHIDIENKFVVGVCKAKDLQIPKENIFDILGIDSLKF